jgi:hypothetical protein
LFKTIMKQHGAMPHRAAELAVRSAAQSMDRRTRADLRCPRAHLVTGLLCCLPCRFLGSSGWALPDTHRLLPLLDLAMPVLRQMSPRQYRAFRAQAEGAAFQDGRPTRPERDGHEGEPCPQWLLVGKVYFTSAALVGAAMCSAFECGSHDRWP